LKFVKLSCFVIAETLGIRALTGGNAGHKNTIGEYAEGSMAMPEEHIKREYIGLAATHESARLWLMAPEIAPFVKKLIEMLDDQRER
jgi:hypothetical protein